MRKFLVMLIALLLVMAVVGVSAETVANEADRNIKPVALQADGNFALNPVIEGESPVTGLPWSGRYQPVLVQVDNATGGVGQVIHWGISAADVMYETLLASNGTTRISALFNDKLPEAVGPVRSARVAHAWLRQEWQAAFCFYGCQTATGTNVREEFSKFGLKTAWNILCDGTAGSGKAWRKYYAVVPKLAPPHNKEVDVGAIQDLVNPADYQAKERPFLFSDSKPTTGEFADFIWIENIRKQSVSPSYVYNADENVYYRYVGGLPYYDKDLGPEDGHQAFSNVIVQRCDTSFATGGSNPLTPVALHDGVAKGNAEIFMGGRYIKGYWMRTGMDERTVFLDAEGNEIALQRGRTFIQIVNNNAEVTYSCDQDVMEQLLAEARAEIDADRAEAVEDVDDLIDGEEDPDEQGEPAVEQNEPAEEQAAPVEEQVDQSEAVEQVPVDGQNYEQSVTGKATTSVKVRVGPSKNDKVAGTLKKGAKVTILGEEGDWYKINFKKKECYVMKEFIKVGE